MAVETDTEPLTLMAATAAADGARGHTLALGHDLDRAHDLDRLPDGALSDFPWSPLDRSWFADCLRNISLGG